MIAIYCRQSIDKKDSISIEQQELSCKAFTFGEAYRVYSDKGYTGANTNRPEFSALMTDIQNGLIEKVIVYKVDRISRSLQDFVGIHSEFEKHNVEFVSCNEQFDTSTAMGKATLQIIMVFAELERNMIQKRVKDNFYERAKKGLFLAGVAPYGFKKVPVEIEGIHTHMLQEDDEHPERMQAVRMAYNDFNAGCSLGDIVRKLNSMGFTTNRGLRFSNVSVGRMLKNPVYVRANADVYMYLKSKGATMNQPIEDYIGVYGCTIYGDRKIKTTQKFTDLHGDYVQMNLHEGVIDAFQWLSVQHQLDKNRPVHNSGRGKNTWLTGLTKCGFCGLAISVVNGQRNGKRYINCGGRVAKYCYDRKRTITFDEIEEIVAEDLIKHIRDFEFSRIEQKQHISRKENELKMRLTALESEISALIEKVPDANDILIGYINKRVAELDKEKTELTNELNAEKSKDAEVITPEMVSKALTDWDSFSFDEKKMIAQTFIDKVVIYDVDIDIIYK